MTRNKNLNRLGATAIATVLALHSTPVFAQVADPATPTTETAVVPVAEPVVVEPITATPAVAAEPVAETSVAAEPVAQPTARSTASRTSARQATLTPRSTVQPEVSQPAAPADTTPVQPTAEAPAPVPPTPVVTDTATAAEAEPSMNTDLPLMAGGAGVAALALLGTGLLASRRRRRRDEMAEGVAETNEVYTQPYVPATEPTIERSAFSWGNPSPRADASSPHSQRLPAGFDLSKYGRHVQAAYRGPTADNPSLSLKKRIKRASFFDLRERQAAAARSGGGVGMNPALVPA